MRTTICRTIIICVVWSSMSLFLTVGLPSLRVSTSDEAPFYCFVIFVGIAGAVVTTPIVWLTGRKKKAHRGFEVVRPVEAIEEAA
jgi:hypothetical protein